MTMLASQITSLTVVYSIVYSGVNQRKHQSSASLAFVREIHRGPVNFPHKWPVTRKMFPFDDVIMCQHFVFLWCCISSPPNSRRQDILHYTTNHLSFSKLMDTILTGTSGPRVPRPVVLGPVLAYGTVWSPSMEGWTAKDHGMRRRTVTMDPVLASIRTPFQFQDLSSTE